MQFDPKEFNVLDSVKFDDFLEIQHVVEISSYLGCCQVDLEAEVFLFDLLVGDD